MRNSFAFWLWGNTGPIVDANLAIDCIQMQIGYSMNFSWSLVVFFPMLLKGKIILVLHEL